MRVFRSHFGQLPREGTELTSSRRFGQRRSCACCTPHAMAGRHRPSSLFSADFGLLCPACSVYCCIMVRRRQLEYHRLAIWYRTQWQNAAQSPLGSKHALSPAILRTDCEHLVNQAFPFLTPNCSAHKSEGNQSNWENCETALETIAAAFLAPLTRSWPCEAVCICSVDPPSTMPPYVLVCLRRTSILVFRRPENRPAA